MTFAKGNDYCFRMITYNHPKVALVPPRDLSVLQPAVRPAAADRIPVGLWQEDPLTFVGPVGVPEHRVSIPASVAAIEHRNVLEHEVSEVDRTAENSNRGEAHQQSPPRTEPILAARRYRHLCRRHHGRHHLTRRRPCDEPRRAGRDPSGRRLAGQ